MVSPRTLTVVLMVAAIAAVACPIAAGATPAAIRGKLSKRGYTVMALATDGRAKTVAANPKFRLKPPTRVVTLHLRDRNGGYAGPVVVGRSGAKAILGVRAGADLGRIAVRSGYAVARAERTDRVKDINARAKDGRPIGAGILGRVRSGVSGRDGLGRDLDRDGLPGAFDADDDGDLIFDNVDRSTAAARPSVGGSGPIAVTAELYNARWVINGGLAVSYLADEQGYTKGVAGYTLNQNAAGPFAASGEFEKLRDLLMINRAAIIMPLLSEPSELDCGYRATAPTAPGLPYCSPGGTGSFITRRQKFPDQFDGDGDGFGLMTAVPAFAEGQDGLGLIQTVDPKTVFGLAPNAKEADIQAGDTYIARAVTDNEIGRPITLRTVFGTLPALSSWGDSARNVAIDYPVPRGAEGAENNGFTVQPNADGEHVVRLTIWRPQRDAFDGSGEGTGWIDLGGLTYTVVGKTAEQNRRLFRCQGSSYSTSDGNLDVTPDGLLDKAADEPVNVANTLTFSVNLTQCLKSSGITEQRPPTINLFVAASSRYGDTAEGLGFSFKLAAKDDVASDAFSGTWKFAGGTPGPELEWTITANNGSSSRIGVIVYDNRTVVSGTPPAGWNCVIMRADGNPNLPKDSYQCDGSTLSSGQSVTGRVMLDGAYDQNKPVNMLICSGDNCSGLGMTYKP